MEKLKGYIKEDDLTKKLSNDIYNLANSKQDKLTISSSTASTSTTQVANSYAVKQAMDRADQAFQSASDGKKLISNAIAGKGITVTNTSGSNYPSFNDLINGINNIKTADSLNKDELINLVKDKVGNKLYEPGDFVRTKFDTKSWLLLENTKVYEENIFFTDKHCFVYTDEGKTIKFDKKGNKLKEIDCHIKFVCEKFGYNITDKKITIYDTDFNILKQGISNNIFDNKIVGVNNNYSVLIRKFDTNLDSKYSRYKYTLTDINGSVIWEQRGRNGVGEYQKNVGFVNDHETGELYICYNYTKNKIVEDSNQVDMYSKFISTSDSSNEMKFRLIDNDLYTIETIKGSTYVFSINKNGKNFYYDEIKKMDLHTCYPTVFKKNGKMHILLSKNLYVEEFGQLNILREDFYSTILPDKHINSSSYRSYPSLDTHITDKGMISYITNKQSYDHYTTDIYYTDFGNMIL